MVQILRRGDNRKDAIVASFMCKNKGKSCRRVTVNPVVNVIKLFLG